MKVAAMPQMALYFALRSFRFAGLAIRIAENKFQQQRDYRRQQRQGICGQPKYALYQQAAANKPAACGGNEPVYGQHGHLRGNRMKGGSETEAGHEAQKRVRQGV